MPGCGLPQPGGGCPVGVATIGSEDIVNGSIRNRDFKDGTLRGQEAKLNGFGGGAIKETTLDPSQLDANDIGKVRNAGAALGREGLHLQRDAGRSRRRRAAGRGDAVSSLADNANGVLVVTRDLIVSC